jgi:uncharacterized protein (DUF1330 family)
MKQSMTIGLAMLAGAVFGAAAIQALHAQAKPPIYVVTEIDASNLDSYLKEYAPKAQEIIRSHGGRVLAAGQNVTTLEGERVKPRVAITSWDSMDKIQAWRNSAEFKANRQTGEKYAKFRSFTAEGSAQ